MWGKLLGQDASNKAAQHISDDQSTHTAVGLTQGNDASDPDGSKDRSGHLCTGELLNRAMSKRQSSSSSSMTRRCSLVAPDGPAADPRRAHCRHVTRACCGNGRGSSGWKRSTSSLCGPYGSAGRPAWGAGLVRRKPAVRVAGCGQKSDEGAAPPSMGSRPGYGR